MAVFKINNALRAELLVAINKCTSLSSCAKRFGVDRKTLYTELTQKSYYKPSQYFCSKCINRFNCTHWEQDLDGFRKSDLIKLGSCKMLKWNICDKLKHYPFVCNYCTEKCKCKRLKRYYDPCIAQDISNELKSIPRKVIKLDNKQLSKINQIVTPLIRNGLSLYHIWWSNPYIKNQICESTLKSYLYDGRFDAKSYELQMKVRYAPIRKETLIRKAKSVIYRDDNRDFRNFIDYINQKSIGQDYWEYDSVVGKRSDSKAILTITYVEFDFQFGLVIEKDNPKDVVDKIRQLQKKLGEKYRNIFKVNLSDNGIEFDNFTDIEFDETTGEVLCKTFRTRPHIASDKADCECNHKLVRYILPKYQSLDFITQEQCNLVFSHVNSLIRKSKNNKTPYELFVERFGKEVADILGINFVKPNEVCLKPFLLKKN